MYIFDYTIKDMLSDDVLNPTVINVRRAGDNLDTLKGNIKPHILDAVVSSSVYIITIDIYESGSPDIKYNFLEKIEFAATVDVELNMFSSSDFD